MSITPGSLFLTIFHLYCLCHSLNTLNLRVQVTEKRRGWPYLGFQAKDTHREGTTSLLKLELERRAKRQSN
jgi:hypothetical protein